MGVCICAGLLPGVESITIPKSTIQATVPAGWSQLPADGTTTVLRGPGRIPSNSPRLSLACAASDPETTSASLRTSLLKITDGCQILDDDELPIGGRVWRRLRVRFAIGPLQFGQSAWIGSVSGRTTIVILSAPEDDLPAHLGTASELLGSFHATP